MYCEASDPEGIEERAAIMEYDGGLTRKEAENAAARLHGYTDWREYCEFRDRVKDNRHMAR